MLEAGVARPYRLELFRAWLPRTTEDGGGGAGRGGDLERGRAADPIVPRAAARTDRRRLDLADYAPLLVLTGRPLLKALAALDVAREQLDLEWMTPAEVEYLLTERGHVRSVYRTNVSTALRAAGDLVERRRRGRGFEYRIRDAGRDALRRELRLRGGRMG